MTDDRSNRKQDPTPSELGAAEAISSRPSADEAALAGARPCPSCGRMVEAGFRFCDGCGTPLDSSAPKAPAEPWRPTPIPSAPREDKESLLDRWRRRRREESGSPAVAASAESLPLIERWRRRRAERSELAEAERVLGATPEQETEEDVSGETPQPSRPGPLGATSRLTPAEELHGARPVIGGRLRWSGETDTDEQTQTVPPPRAEAEPAVWRPIPAGPTVAVEEGRRSEPLRFAFHLAIAFLSGAAALIILTGLASILSDGSVALLEKRGLPIFIGGATSIVVFALLRTSGKATEPGASRSTSIASVVTGLIILVLLAALLYRPAAAERLQPRIERALNVFAPEDEAAANGFRQDLELWNDDSARYRGMLESSVRSGIDVDEFRTRARDTEVELEDLIAQMRQHAEDAQHPGLRDALKDLASIYEEELGGLRLVNRGLLVDGYDLVRTGDTRFKDADRHAKAFFRDRLKRLLERAGIDADAFGEAING